MSRDVGMDDCVTERQTMMIKARRGGSDSVLVASRCDRSMMQNAFYPLKLGSSCDQ